MQKKIIELDLNQKKEILVEILQYFHDFCLKNNLRYSLSSGTILGAIRHKGFIPWDDDVDVCMPRKDYNELIKTFNRQNKHGKYKLLTYKNHGFYSNFAKIIDTNTVAKETKRNEKAGLWLDIFIVEQLNSNNFSDYINVIRNVKNLRYLGDSSYYIKSNKNILNIFKNVYKFFYKLFFKNIFIKRIEKFILNNRGAHNMQLTFEHTVKIWCNMPELNFDELITVEFENRQFKCFSQWKQYLETRYGKDYMVLPPISERINHTLDYAYKVIK